MAGSRYLDGSGPKVKEVVLRLLINARQIDARQWFDCAARTAKGLRARDRESITGESFNRGNVVSMPRSSVELH